MTVSPDSIRRLPKIDLHHHLDGAIRTETIIELAKKYDVSLPSYEVNTLESHVTVQPDCRSLTDFLDCFETFYPVLQYPEAVERVAYELCEDFESENGLYLETRFAPVLLTNEDADQADVVRAAIRGLKRGQETFDVEVNLILCLYRGHERSENETTLSLALNYQDEMIVGVDLAGDEDKHGEFAHPELFREACEENLSVTIHAGEAGPAENVRNALEVGADRIGHGIRAVDDEALMDELAQSDVPLEICFTSNLQTQAVSSPLEHPFQKFYRRGLNVTINTDDPRVSKTTINREFTQVSETFDLGIDDCRSVLRNAAHAAFVSPEKSRKLKQAITDTTATDGD